MGYLREKLVSKKSIIILNLESIFGINRAILISLEIVYARNSSIIQH